MPKTTEQPQSPESLERIASHLDAISAAIRSAAAVMRVGRVASVLVANHKSLVSGLDRIEGWLAAVRRATIGTRSDRGDYTASGDTVSDSGDTNQPAEGHRGTKTPKRGTPKRKKP